MPTLVDLSTLLIQVGGLAFLIEVIVEILKRVYPGQIAANVLFIVTLVLGVAIAIVSNISLFVTDSQVLFYFGAVLAGAIASRGSNAVHNIIDAIAAISTKKK